jgi:hypothetical protein
LGAPSAWAATHIAPINNAPAKNVDVLFMSIGAFFTSVGVFFILANAFFSQNPAEETFLRLG